jgi:hypothetical protein
LGTADRAYLVGLLKFLEAFGEQGEWVWKVGLCIDDEAERLGYLRNAVAWLNARAAASVTVPYRWLPVDFRTFVDSPALLKKKGKLWPRVMEACEEINKGDYVECVLTGGIGVAKTTIAIYSQAYQLYNQSCLLNPHELYDLDTSSEILTVFQSLNRNLAMDVDYRRFRDMIDNSPYFNAVFPFDTDRQSEMRFDRNIVVKPVSGQETGALGQNVIGGIIDEVNFMAVVEDSKLKRDGTTYDQAVENYNSIARRRESRFMQLGTLPGMLCLVSSKNYPGGLTDTKTAEARTNPTIYVYDKRLWDVRPERFSGEMFKVFVGDETRAPRILDDGEVIVPTDEPLTVAVPVEYRRTFDGDLIKSIRDIGGHSTQSMHPFMLNTFAISKAFGDVQSIASREAVDFKTTTLDLFPQRIVNPQAPRFIHIDLAISKDSAGFACGHVSDFMLVNRGDYKEALPVIRFDMLLEIRPPPGGEIVYDKIRSIIYTLRDKLGLPVKWVSFDTFQSTDSMQMLAVNGFVTGYQSVDTSTDAYDLTKQAIYDGRMHAPAHHKAQKELTTLEFHAKEGKVDHPPNGSKDVADAMAGVVFGLTMRREIWLRHGVPMSRLPVSVSRIVNKASLDVQEKAMPYMDVVRKARGVEIGVRRDDV